MISICTAIPHNINNYEGDLSLMKKYIVMLISCLLVLTAFGSALADAVPSLKLSYIVTTHHTPIIAAMAKGDGMKVGAPYLKPIVPKEKYELISDGKRIATIDIIVAKSGSETATLFAMKRVDVALASITALTTAVDKGTPIKVLSPLHTDGIAFVVPKDSPLRDWKSFVAHVKASKKPVTIGYHSPTSAPKIVLEGALVKEGLRVSEKATDPNAQIILVDLKTTSNFIPSLASRQVDAFVAPAPFPEVASIKGAGKVLLDLRDLPPAGHWHNFPCCVFAATDDIIKKHPSVIKKLVELMETSTAWCNSHKNEVASISASWMGVPAEAVKKSTIAYTTVPSKNWLRGVGLYLEKQNQLKDFSGRLAGKSLTEAMPLLFNFSFLSKK